MNFLYTVFKTKNSHYLYDAVTNHILEISPVLYSNHQMIFREISAQEGSVPPAELRDSAVMLNTIRDVRDKVRSGLIRPVRLTGMNFGFDPGEYFDSLSHSMKCMILEITEKCNLRCNYCCYSGHYPSKRSHGSSSMALDTALKAVSFLHSHSSQSPAIRLGFFGGEPLLEFDTIVKVLEYAERCFKSPERSRCYEIITNGTLLKERVIDWIARQNSREEGLQVRVIVSLNGPAGIHDSSRRSAGGAGTHRTIIRNLTLFKKKYPSIFHDRLSIQADYRTLADIPLQHHFFEHHPLFKGRQIILNRVNPVSGDDYMKAMTSLPEGVSEQDIMQVIKESLGKELRRGRNGRSTLKSFLGADLIKIHRRTESILGEKEPFRRVCRPLLTKCHVRTDGSLHLCERMDVSGNFGSIFSDIDRDRLHDFISFFRETMEKECCSCAAVRFCSLCFENLFSSEGYDREKHSLSCRICRELFTGNLRTYCEMRELKADIFQNCNSGEYF